MIKFSSCIYSGFVTHKRFKPKKHFFSYKTFSLLINLSEIKKIAINYTTLEPFPLPSEIVDKLNYPISVKENDCFLKIHNCEWEETQKIIEGFSIKKKKVRDFRVVAECTSSLSRVYHNP